jgi:hypothetical protein
METLEIEEPINLFKETIKSFDKILVILFYSSKDQGHLDFKDTFVEYVQL